MWDFCLVNSSQSFPVKCISLSFSLSLSLYHAQTHAKDSSRNQCCMFPALSGPLHIILKSVDLTKALINGVLLAFCFSLTFKSAESLVHLVERKVGEKGQREKWQRERRGEREIFLFISGCKERTSGEVRGFKGSMFSVQGSESCGGKKCGLHGIYETFQTCTFKELCDPVHTHMHTGQLTHTHTYGKLCDVIDLSIYQFLFCQSRPPPFSCPVWNCSFFWTEK